MEKQQKQSFDKASGQIIIYYPFRFKETNRKENNKSIKTTKVSIKDNIELYHDDFIKLVDTENSEDKFGREIYTVALGPIDELSKKIYQSKFENEDNKTINEFKKMLENTMLDIPTDPSLQLKENQNENNTESLPQLLKTNVVLYKKTHIGIFELFLSYTFEKSKNYEKAANLIADKAGKLKKLFFVDDNATEYLKRESNNLKIYKYNTDMFIEYIKNLKDVNIDIKEEDILFNCIRGKKRAYSFCQMFVSQENYTKQINDKVDIKCKEEKIEQNDKEKRNRIEEKIKEETENKIMLCLGRAHSNDGRIFNNEVAKRFKYEDENSCHHSITASSLGTLILCHDMSNYVYYMQHMQEQYAFVYELCLHQRFYLYTVIEDYRKTEQNYYAIKSNFTEMITRYNLSLVSEVEPQVVYTKIRQAMNIEAITKDAEKALDMLQAKEEKKKSVESEKFSRLLSILGLVMTTLNFISFVMDNNAINLNKLYIALFIFIIGVLAWILPYTKK